MKEWGKIGQNRIEIKINLTVLHGNKNIQFDKPFLCRVCTHEQANMHVLHL